MLSLTLLYLEHLTTGYMRSKKSYCASSLNAESCNIKSFLDLKVAREYAMRNLVQILI